MAVPEISAKDSFHFESVNYEGLGEFDIDENVTLIIEGKVRSLSRGNFGSKDKKGMSISIEVKNVKRASNKPAMQSSLPGHKVNA